MCNEGSTVGASQKPTPCDALEDSEPPSAEGKYLPLHLFDLKPTWLMLGSDGRDGVLPGIKSPGGKDIHTELKI